MRVVFTEAILNNPDMLIAWWQGNVGPILSKLFAHHMTIKFKPSPEEVESLVFGKEVLLQVVGYADDGKGQAVLVRPIGVRSSNDMPHITVSTDGRSPVYSNELLKERVVAFEGPVFTATIGYFDGKEHRTE